MHAPGPWEESAKRWLRVESVPSTHAVGMADMGRLVVLEGAEYWACVRVETGGLEWVVVTACRLRRQQSRGPACYRVFQECLSGLGPVRRAHRCTAEHIPPAPAVFLEVTRPPVVQGQDVWPIAPSNMWQAGHAAGICKALQGHAAALPRAPAAQSSSNRPAASLALLHNASRAWYWVVAALEPHSSALRLYDRGQGTVLTVRPDDLEALHLSALSGDGGDALYLQGTVAGAAATRFRRQSGGDALRLVMAENMGPWLRAFSTSRWKVEGDREKFADAWRRWVEEQFPVGGMLHLPQPPSVPPVRPAATPAAAARQAPKAAPKPPPKRSPPPQYGAYANIRYVLQHFGGDLATDQRGTKTINVCPWSRLDGAGHCTWKAGKHCRPTHLHPKDLLDHIQRDHATHPAQRDQALAMLTGVMPGGQAGPFASAQAGSRALTLPTGARPAASAGRPRRRHDLERLGLQHGVGQCLLRGIRRQVHPADRQRGNPPHLPGLSRRRPPRAEAHGVRGHLAIRPRRVRVVPLNLLVAPLRPVIRIRRGAPIHTCSHEGAQPPTPERRCPGTSRARCGGTVYQWPQVCSTVKRWRRAS